MTSNQQNLLELAKQGNSRAIAALINRSLRPKGITAKVNLKGNSLQILVESDKALDQEPITQFLVRGVKKLNIESIDSIKIKIFGKQNGQDFPDWTQDIPLQNNLKESEIQKSPLSGDPAVSEETQISAINRKVKSDSSASSTTRQDARSHSEQDIWTKSKVVTFSVLKSAWRWYLSGFKSRPDLPLFLSPRLYRIIFTFFAFVWITAPFGLYEQTTTSTSPTGNSSSNGLSPSCDSAGGRIWTGVRLHHDSGCSRPFATVVGGGRLRNGERGVLIQFDTGELEWKTRSAVMNQTYVRTDDPAHSARLWRDIDQ